MEDAHKPITLELQAQFDKLLDDSLMPVGVIIGTDKLNELEKEQPPNTGYRLINIEVGDKLLNILEDKKNKDRITMYGEKMHTPNTP
jgi:hypothetical protein